MSAIGLLPSPRQGSKLSISSHADYRRNDFMFSRTQSGALRDMPWERRAKPLQSWDRLVYSCVGAAAFAVTMLELFR
jgi:hypothetical protein